MRQQLCHNHPTSMPMGIVISCIRPSIRPSMGLSLGIADKSLGRNGLHFGTLMYPYDLPLVYRRFSGLLSFSSFVRPFGFGFDLGWGMVVTITEGNRWYLLPLLTAHPGCFTPMSWRNVLSHWLRPCSITHKEMSIAVTCYASSASVWTHLLSNEYTYFYHI